MFHSAELDRAIRIVPFLIFLVAMILDEMRILLMYFTATESFMNIRLAMEAQLKVTDQMSHRDVSKWTQILQQLRHNVTLTGRLQAPLQIPVFLQSLLVFTGLLFIAIQSLMTGNGSQHLILATFIGSSFMTRMVLKIVMAESIVTEVRP